ncbi:BRO family protein [Nonomuraea sp. NPDC050310]|uniref:BRO family protein n=1 Tax=Nonomuraea sp. NPDC050310 TaxID=3154935 RepID=UPI0033E081B4
MNNRQRPRRQLVTAPLAIVNGSPFDTIRRFDKEGEYWSARDLMEPMGYSRWSDYRPVLDRAMASATAHAASTDDLFRVTPEKTAGRPREDFRLARFAAYLVAMNGDPRKPEVARAQAYFALRTREAELGWGAEHDTSGAALIPVAALHELQYFAWTAWVSLSELIAAHGTQHRPHLSGARRGRRRHP